MVTLYNHRYGVLYVGCYGTDIQNSPVNFDLDVGPIVQNVVPETALSATERQDMSVAMYFRLSIEQASDLGVEHSHPFRTPRTFSQAHRSIPFVYGTGRLHLQNLNIFPLMATFTVTVFSTNNGIRHRNEGTRKLVLAI
jgi:hypothetical protein